MLINGQEINVAQRRKEIQRKDGSGKTLSQADIARYCGISITAEQRYENNTTKNPMPEVLVKLAEILEVE
jgi:transcriptional regulator with XRE-family HTH domain